MSKGDNSPGASKFAGAIRKIMDRNTNNALVLDFGVIQSDGSLLTDEYPISDVYKRQIESSVPYADYMENGTPGGKIAPRPFAERIIEKARPKIEAIYDEPFDLNL